MSENIEHPIVFLSYARTNQEHIEKITNFASILRKDGIDVKFDEWDLKVGNDLYFFMENNIKRESDKVLLILTKEFVEKANDRKSGVGTETQLISKEVYDDVKQERIIPIVWECDEKGEAYIPTFLESRLYIDLSTKEKFGKNYETLLRILYNKPKNPKEDLGEMPKWLNDTNKYYPKTNEVVKRFNYSIQHHPNEINPIMEEFCEEYYEYLKTFTIEFSSNNINTISGELYKDLEEYQQLKNDFEEFIDILSKKGKYYGADYRILVEFLIKVHSLTFNRRDRKSMNTYDLYKFSFILKELFLYMIAYGLKNKNYNLITDLLHSPYYLTDENNQLKGTQHFVELDIRSQGDINGYIDNYYKENENTNYISPLGQLLISRLPISLNSEYLIDADLLCCYVSFLNKEEYKNEFWFPYTYVYKGRRWDSFEIFRRLTSKRYFEEVKEIFNVKTINEFKSKVISTHDSLLGQRQIRLSNSWGEYVEPIEEYINLDEIGCEK